MGATRLSNLQVELLKIYSTNLPDEQLMEIKLLLSNYFANKVTTEMDLLWEHNQWNEQTMKQWANGHFRR